MALGSAIHNAVRESAIWCVCNTYLFCVGEEIAITFNGEKSGGKGEKQVAISCMGIIQNQLHISQSMGEKMLLSRKWEYRSFDGIEANAIMGIILFLVLRLEKKNLLDLSIIFFWEITLNGIEWLILSYVIILFEMDVFKASIKWLLPSKHGTVESHRRGGGKTFN